MDNMPLSSKAKAMRRTNRILSQLNIGCKKCKKLSCICNGCFGRNDHQMAKFNVTSIFDGIPGPAIMTCHKCGISYMHGSSHKCLKYV